MKKVLLLSVIHVVLSFKPAYSQANAVVNGNFSSALSDWTSGGGWGTAGGRAVNYDNDNVVQPLSQALTNVLVTSGTISISFDYRNFNCVCLLSQSYTNLDVSFGGTTYLRLAVPTGIGNVTATLYGGASINTTSFPQLFMTSLILTIPWSGSSPASGTLSFTHLPSGGYDDSFIDNVFVEAVLTPIPVKLTRFLGREANFGADLQWETSSEISFDEFVIENSADGISFRKVGSVKASGNPDGSRYGFNSNHVNFFRLKMVDIDGKFEYSNIIRISSHNGERNTATVFPNPLSGKTFSLATNNQKLINTMAELCSMDGKKLKIFTITNSLQKVSIGDFPGGIYFLKLEDGQVLKMIKR